MKNKALVLTSTALAIAGIVTIIAGYPMLGMWLATGANLVGWADSIRLRNQLSKQPNRRR